MAEPSASRGVIPADAVRASAHPVLVGCGQSGEGPGQKPISVVPVLDGNTVAGFEVRCHCGASVIVECIYEEEE